MMDHTCGNIKKQYGYLALKRPCLSVQSYSYWGGKINHGRDNRKAYDRSWKTTHERVNQSSGKERHHLLRKEENKKKMRIC